MKFWVAAVAALLLTMLIVSNSSASMAQFSGKWENSGPSTGGRVLHLRRLFPKTILAFALFVLYYMQV
jgi:hypothetical protein